MYARNIYTVLGIPSLCLVWLVCELGHFRLVHQVSGARHRGPKQLERSTTAGKAKASKNSAKRAYNVEAHLKRSHDARLRKGEVSAELVQVFCDETGSGERFLEDPWSRVR